MAQSGTEERKTSTILAMDVARYSQLMGIDEEGTLKQLKACREIIETKVSEAKGRIFNTAGDAFMVEFSNTLSAVNAAIAIQKQISEHNQKIADASKRLYFRMGINLGDVMIDGDNLLGDGVNVAARLEGIAPPGGICISEIVHTTVQGKLECGFIDKGEQKLKNITYSVKAYYLDIKTGEIDPKKFKAPTAKSKTGMYIGGLVVASIAAILFIVNPFKEKVLDINNILVIPFENLGDKSRDNFVAGIPNNIVNGLNRISKNLNVIGYGKVPENLKDFANESNSKYIITGNVQEDKDQIRLVINLLDGQNLSTIWNKTYDKNTQEESIFTIQDSVVEDVISELVGDGNVLAQDIAKNVVSRGTTIQSAAECVNWVKVVAMKTMTRESNQKARECLKVAIESDPNFAEAFTLYAGELAWCYSLFQACNFDVLTEAFGVINKSLSLDNTDPFAHRVKADIHFFQKDWNRMYSASEKAIELGSNRSQVLGSLSQYYLWGGTCTREEIVDTNAKKGTYYDGNCRWQKGVELALKAFQLDTVNIFPNENFPLAIHYIIAKKYNKTLEAMDAHPAPGFVWHDIYVGTALDGLGDETKAKEYFERTKSVLGTDNIDVWFNQFQFWNIHETYWPTFEPVLRKYGFN